MFLFKKNKINRKTNEIPQLYRMKRSMIEWLKYGGIAFVSILVTFSCYQFFFRSSYFHLKKVDIRGSLNHLNKDTLMRLAEIPQEKNIFGLNLYQIRQNIKRFNWIEEVQVRRQFPNSLVIEVREFEPVAILVLSLSESYYVNQEGILFDRVKNPRDLPLITGFDPDQLKKYPGYYRPRLKEVFLFVNQFKQSLLGGPYQLGRVDYSLTEGITAIVKDTTRQAEIKIYFGKAKLEEKIKQWSLIYPHLEKEAPVMSVDLHVENKVFAKEEIYGPK